MSTIKYTAFYLLAFLSVHYVYAQPHITLLDNPFVCKGCDANTTKQQLKLDVRQKNTVDLACQMLLPNFTMPGDQFVLHCDTCYHKVFTYINRTISKKLPKTFSTTISLRHGGQQRGDETFYTLQNLFNFLTDSLLVFDSIRLSMRVVTDAGNIDMGSLRASYIYKGVAIDRSIPFDPDQREFVLHYKTLFGNKLTRDITDTIRVQLTYINADHEPVNISRPLQVFFAADTEKEELLLLAALHKQLYPGWSLDKLTNELFKYLTEKYKQASPNNFSAWLQHHLP